MPTKTEDIILNTVKKLRENGITDSKAVAKVVEVAMDVQELSDKVHGTNKNASTLNAKMPWEDGYQEPKRLVRNTAPKHGLNSKMPWEE